MHAATQESGSPGELRRALGVTGAVLLGLGSILGTGVFVSIGIGAGVAGAGVLPAIALAACVALCNALSSAQLAARYPVSGGTYEYGYRLLHPALGFTAGWMFLCAKSASAATAALGCLGYAVHGLGLDVAPAWLRVGGVLVVAVLTALVCGGMRRSSRANAAIVGVTIAALLLFVVRGLPALLRDGAQHLAPLIPSTGEGGWGAMLHATALMFVAYTGYGRIATLGEEVHAPRRTIPRAILATLAVSAALYLAVALVAVGSAGSAAVAGATQGAAAPLEVILHLHGAPWAARLVGLGAVTAMLGVLLNLLLGLSRVLLAMGRRGDIPTSMARLDAKGEPTLAVLAVGLLVASLAATGSVRTTWSFSAFTVLIYYSLTNLAVLRLKPEQRLYPRAFAWCGLIACVALAFQVEPRVWLTGGAALLVGLAWHRVRRASYGRDAV